MAVTCEVNGSPLISQCDVDRFLLSPKLRCINRDRWLVRPERCRSSGARAARTPPAGGGALGGWMANGPPLNLGKTPKSALPPGTGRHIAGHRAATKAYDRSHCTEGSGRRPCLAVLWVPRIYSAAGAV